MTSVDEVVGVVVTGVPPGVEIGHGGIMRVATDIFRRAPLYY